ncbi:hypothetical protein [Thioclava sp. DLFJ5-1]|uniref:hypothetical protein n=1 Tax=Thioclava sp. DLFJ5-1 TaxID=1915314 RepID=UPI001AF026E3|nr:hypothetical protein [Thioclava sp. DLFJ5-1]
MALDLQAAAVLAFEREVILVLDASDDAVALCFGGIDPVLVDLARVHRLIFATDVQDDGILLGHRGPSMNGQEERAQSSRARI